MQRCHSPCARCWQSWREKLWSETSATAARESMEVVQGQSRRGWREIPALAGLGNPLFFCFGSQYHPGAAPEVTHAEWPSELEDGDGAANLFLFRGCSESVRIKSGTFAHFIRSVHPLPRGVRCGSLSSGTTHKAARSGGSFLPLAWCLPPGISPCLGSSQV